MLLETLLAFCFRGLRALLFDAQAPREHLRGSRAELHNGTGLRWAARGGGGGPAAGLGAPDSTRRRAVVSGAEPSPMGAEALGTHQGASSAARLAISKARGSWRLCVPALKLGSESVVMRFYYVFWRGLVILCVDLLYNELSDFEMFCATIFWKGHCILFMGRVSFYETLFSF